MEYTLEHRNYLASRYGVQVPIKRERKYIRCSTCPEIILTKDLVDGTPNTVDGAPMCPVCVWELGVSYDR